MFFFPSRILSCMSICLHYWAKKSHPIPAINPMFTLGSRMFFKVRHLGKKKDEFEANDRLFFRRSPSYNVPILYDFFPLSLPLFIGLDTLPSLREFIGGMENVTFGKVHMGKWL